MLSLRSAISRPILAGVTHPTRMDETEGVPPIVLVVDDDLDTRALYDQVLSRAGMWVSQAADARQGLESAVELKPDAILTDIGMPGASGVELLTLLRADSRTVDVPVIAVTGWGKEKIPANADFAAILLKPVGLESLVEDVRRVLERSRELRERGRRAAERLPQLIERSNRAKQRAGRALENLASAIAEGRECPTCRTAFEFIEVRRLDGSEFEYFKPCRHGCGLFCYDRERRRLVTLI
jgi:DNA-binding response OmpR family regulator